MKNIIFLVFLSFFLLSCDEDKPAKDAPIPKIAWMEVSVTGVEQSRRLSGQLNPREGASLSFNKVSLRGKVDTLRISLTQPCQNLTLFYFTS